MPFPNDANQASNYDRCGNTNEYTFNPGVCILPLAEDPPEDSTELAAWSPIVSLRLHAPYRIRKFFQLGEKSQNPSPIAAPGDTGKFIFIGGTLTVTTNLNTTSVNYDWSTGCSYLFVENCTSRDTDGNELGLVLGTTPVNTFTDYLNANQYGYSPPELGAVADGGRSARTGYHMGQSIVTGTGELNNVWGYNQPAFYPATLFYDDLANGGQPFSEGGF